MQTGPLIARPVHAYLNLTDRLMPVTANSRLRATAHHVLISVGVLCLAVYPLLVQWYPPPLLTGYAGWRVVAMLALVTLATGPLLTLVIFKPAKAKHLIVFDLVCITVIQVAALAYGLHTVHATRPVVLAYWDGMVYPITPEELAPQEVQPAQLQTFSETRPPLVFVRKPGNRQETAAMLRYGFNNNLSEPSLAFLYEPLAGRLEHLFAASVENRRRPRPAWLQARTDYLQRTRQSSSLAFIPFAGRYGQRLLVINQQGRLIDALPVSADAATGVP